jgi:hypothetical protein
MAYYSAHKQSLHNPLLDVTTRLDVKLDVGGGWADVLTSKAPEH